MELENYEDAWNYLKVMISGVSQLSSNLNIDRLLDTMYNIESKVNNSDQ